MPLISQFHGLLITMYHDDHGPPHFHVHEGGNLSAFVFTGELLRGRASARARRLVRQWARLHRRELELNWELARRLQPLVRIAPLK
jgi:uncharacterized heparinase superfamily protein